MTTGIELGGTEPGDTIEATNCEDGCIALNIDSSWGLIPEPGCGCSCSIRLRPVQAMELGKWLVSQCPVQ